MPFRLKLTILLLVSCALSCGVLGGGEKYEDATVGEAMGGAVLSPTNTYRISNPEIEAVIGDHALLRDGRSVQILAADGFEEAYADLEGKDYRLLVKKWPNPYPHFRLQGIEIGEEELDATWVLGESELPLLIGHELYDVSRFQETEVDSTTWTSGNVGLDLVDKPMWIPVQVEYSVVEVTEEEAEEDSAEGEMTTSGRMLDSLGEAAVADSEMVVRGERAQEKAYRDRQIITVGDVRLELLPVDEDGVNLLFRGLAKRGATFHMGGYIAEVYSRGRRRETGLAGTFRMEVFDYGGKYVMLR